jgi:hypothetical protein
MRRPKGWQSAAIAVLAMMAIQISPATAFTLSSSAGREELLSPQIEKVWCRWGCGGGWGWRGGHWGFWGPGAVVGGLAAGAVVGAAVAGSGPCWRRVIGPYGGVHWRNVC